MVDVDAAALTNRLRTRFVAAQGRVAELPEAVRFAAQRLVERVRIALDIPSRTELADLTARLEELDRRIAELATARVEEMTRLVPSLPAPAVEETPALEAAAGVAAEPAPVEAAPEAEAASPVEEPAAEASPETNKDARRRKISRRANANKTSRR